MKSRNRKNICLKMSPVGPFFSEEDENHFFLWLGKIKSVKKVEGHLHTLNIEVDHKLTGTDELLEFIALFLRYNVDVKQLAVFKELKNSKQIKPWRDLIFGDKTPVAKKEEAANFAKSLKDKSQRGRSKLKTI
jgi:hypothetical protein